MQTYFFPSSIFAPLSPAVYAIGNFDGVHQGHQEIIKKARLLAKDKGAKAGAITFEPHPRQIVSRETFHSRLTPFFHKQRELEKSGIEQLVSIAFTSEFARTSAAHFLHALVKETFQAVHLVVGENFVFGANREGGTTFLRNQAALLGIDVTVLPLKKDAVGLPFASRRICTLLKEGDIVTANALLGRPYRIIGPVVQGDRRGTTLGFPTANVESSSYLLPQRGVYAVTCPFNGNSSVRGVANIGIRPTFNGTQEVLEVHLLNRKEDLYNTILEVEFHAFLRPEKKFPTVTELVAQIGQDCLEAEHFFLLSSRLRKPRLRKPRLRKPQGLKVIILVKLFGYSSKGFCAIAFFFFQTLFSINKLLLKLFGYGYFSKKKIFLKNRPQSQVSLGVEGYRKGEKTLNFVSTLCKLSF